MDWIEKIRQCLGILGSTVDGHGTKFVEVTQRGIGKILGGNGVCRHLVVPWLKAMSSWRYDLFNNPNRFWNVMLEISPDNVTVRIENEIKSREEYMGERASNMDLIFHSIGETPVDDTMWGALDPNLSEIATANGLELPSPNLLDLWVTHHKDFVWLISGVESEKLECSSLDDLLCLIERCEEDRAMALVINIRKNDSSGHVVGFWGVGRKSGAYYDPNFGVWFGSFEHVACLATEHLSRTYFKVGGYEEVRIYRVSSLENGFENS